MIYWLHLKFYLFFILVISIYACMTSIALKVLTSTCCATLLGSSICHGSFLLALPSLRREWWLILHLYYLFDLYDCLLEYLMLHKKGTSLYQLFGNYIFLTSLIVECLLVSKTWHNIYFERWMWEVMGSFLCCILHFLFIFLLWLGGMNLCQENLRTLSSYFQCNCDTGQVKRLTGYLLSSIRCSYCLTPMTAVSPKRNEML